MSSPYSILPTGILLLFIYLLSWLLSRLGLIRLVIHRKIWNVLLLITFFVTAGLGLILAIQVNYKIKLPITDKLLVWHVDFGIGMAMIAIFHFLWHLDYYLNLLHFRGEKEKAEESNGDRSDYSNAGGKTVKIQNSRRFPVLTLGITALITQVIMLREFLSVFQGNELVIGTIMANWMVLIGFGAYLGKSVKRIDIPGKFVFYFLFLAGIIPLITVVFINYFRNIIFPVGTMVGFFQIFTGSLFLLLPFCLLSGFLFTFYAYSLSKQYRRNLISDVYSIEAVGSLMGGIIYSFILIYFFRSLQILSLIAVLNFIAGLVYMQDKGMKAIKVMMMLVLAVILAGVFFFRMDIRLKRFLYPNQEIIFMKDTPQGNLVVTESNEQKNFFENNVLFFSTDNVIGNEETVHFPMLQIDSPKKVLLIGGGISGLTDEILKYQIEQIDYVEINPWIMRIGKKYTKSLEDSRIKLINEDARLFIRKTKEKYDVIIINLPSPSSAQINRFYTVEFFRDIKKKASEKAVFSLSLPSTENYVSEKASGVQSVIYHSLKEVFKNVGILPGERNYFIAGDQNLDLNISKLSSDKKIENLYVNQYYIDDEDLSRRSSYILKNISDNPEINKDFRPLAYFMEIGYWMSHFRYNNWVISGIVLLILVFILGRTDTTGIGIFITGFTSSSLEVLFIILFQIVYGYVYNVIGIIITIFMAGLAIGAGMQRKVIRKEHAAVFWKVQVIIAVFSGVVLGFILLMKNIQIGSFFVYILFFIPTLIISMLAGFQFSLASHIQKKGIADRSAGLYSIDLVGSAGGALLISVVLFPVLGLVKVFIIIFLLNIMSGFISFRYSKRV